jgi:(+)-pinoresinol hydroxylase
MRLAVIFLLATAAFGQDLAKGKQVYEYWCATCHGSGPLPGTVALEAKYKGAKPALLTERNDLVPSLTKFFVRKGVSIMPHFRKTEVNDADLEALAAYLAPKK